MREERNEEIKAEVRDARIEEKTRRRQDKERIYKEGGQERRGTETEEEGDGLREME